MSNANQHRRQSRFRFLQFRIRTLLLLIALIAPVLSFIRINQMEMRRIEKLQQHSAVQGWLPQMSSDLDPGITPLLWHCVRTFAGYHRLGYVKIKESNDIDLPDLSKFNELNTLDVRYSKVDFDQLSEVPNLRFLIIDGHWNEMGSADLPSLDTIHVRSDLDDPAYDCPRFPYGISRRTCNSVFHFVKKHPRMRLAFFATNSAQTIGIAEVNPHCRCVNILFPTNFEFPIYAAQDSATP